MRDEASSVSRGISSSNAEVNGRIGNIRSRKHHLRRENPLSQIYAGGAEVACMRVFRRGNDVSASNGSPETSMRNSLPLFRGYGLALTACGGGRRRYTSESERMSERPSLDADGTRGPMKVPKQAGNGTEVGKRKRLRACLNRDSLRGARSAEGKSNEETSLCDDLFVHMELTHSQRHECIPAARRGLASERTPAGSTASLIK